MTSINLTGTPDNLNHLRAGNFNGTLSVDKLPTTAFFLTKWALPSVSLNAAVWNGMNKRLPEPGVNITLDPVGITFAVDENMQNWLEIYTWMSGLGFPINFDQFKALLADSDTKKEIASNLKSNLNFMVLKNNLKPNIQIQFHNAFPISLSGWEFSSDGGENIITATANFEYTHMTFKYV